MNSPPLDDAGYFADGWAVCPGYATARETRELGDHAADLIGSPDDHPTCQYYFDQVRSGDTRLARVERLTDVIAGFSNTRLGLCMAADARRLLGGDVVLFKDKLNIRYADSKGYAPHQDAARWNSFADRFLSIGIFLSHTSPERGGFEFAECQFQEGILNNTRGDLDQNAFSMLPRRSVTASAGDGLVIDGHVPHCTTSNRSGETVLHLLFTFARSADAGLRDAYYRKQADDFAQVRDGNRFTFPPR